MNNCTKNIIKLFADHLKFKFNWAYYLACKP